MKIGNLERNEYPIGLIVDIHDYCNAKCRMCPYEPLRHKLHQGRMEWTLYSKIIDDFAALIERYHFQGTLTYCNMGEPFIQKNLEKYTQYAEERGIRVYLNTNASLMTPEKVDQLIASGFRGAFNISFHAASPQLYKEIMGLPIEDSKRNITYLLQHYPKDKISFNILDDQWPAGEEAKVRELFAGWDMDVRINRPISRGGLVPISKKYIRRLAGCGPDRVLYQMIICHNGDVLLCCHDMARKEVIGNLKDHSIQDVWNGERYRSYLEEIYAGRPSAPDMICHLCEESVPYWSARRFIKSMLPSPVIKWLKSRKQSQWGLSKRIKP